MVYQWYTTYKKIIPLYISNDIDYLIKKHSPKKKVKHEFRSAYIFNKNKKIFNLEVKRED